MERSIATKSASGNSSYSSRERNANRSSPREQAFPDLVEQGQRKHKTVSDELKQLERKDEEDKEEAVMATEKAAKKLKKGKSKKKK